MGTVITFYYGINLKGNIMMIIIIIVIIIIIIIMIIIPCRVTVIKMSPYTECSFYCGDSLHLVL